MKARLASIAATRFWLAGFVRTHPSATALGLIVGVKAGLIVWGVLLRSKGAWPFLPNPVGFLSQSWHHWDARNYLRIAAEGYGIEMHLMPFFPMLPVAYRLIGWMFPGDPQTRAFFVAQICSVAGLFVFYRLSSLEYGPKAALVSLLSLLLFPTAYFFNAFYSEGLFLLFSAGAFLAARQRKWLAAGLLGACASFTRVTGLFLLPALAIEAWSSRWSFSRRWTAVLPLALIPAGFAAYLLINQRIYGDVLAFQDITRALYHKRLAWPWDGMKAVWDRLPAHSASEHIRDTLELAAALLLIGSSVLVARFVRGSYAVFTGLSSLLIVSISYLQSTPRYVLSVFPVFFLVGIAAVRSAWWFWLYAAIGVPLLLWLTRVFVSGGWAY